MRLPRAAVAATALLVACLGIAACSDDDDATVGGTVAPDVEEFCALDERVLAVGAELDRLEAPLRALVAGDLAAAREPMRGLYAAVAQARGVLDDIDAAAPEEIVADVRTVSADVRRVLDALPPEADMLGALDRGDAAAVGALLQPVLDVVTDRRDRAAVEDASSRIRAYVEDHCTG